MYNLVGKPVVDAGLRMVYDAPSAGDTDSDQIDYLVGQSKIIPTIIITIVLSQKRRGGLSSP